MSQQQSAELSSPFLRRFVKGSKSPLVSGVHTSVVLDQQGGYVHVLNRGVEGKRGKKREVAVRDEDENKRKEEDTGGMKSRRD